MSRCGERMLGMGLGLRCVCVGPTGVKLGPNTLGQARNLHIV
jgi:hypothetical protein